MYLYAYGCKAYPLTETWFKDIDRAVRKNWPRADLKYFIGYLGNNLYRIWTFKTKTTSYIVIIIRDVQFDETVFYNPSQFELQQLLQPNVVEIDNDEKNDIESIAPITRTAEPEATDDSNDFERDIDPLEDPLTDRPDSPTDESVYTASESPEILQKSLERRHRTRQLSATARKNLEQSGSVYYSVLHYKTRQPRLVEPGPVGPAANEPDPPELLSVTKAMFIAGRIAKIHQKDLFFKLRN